MKGKKKIIAVSIVIIIVAGILVYFYARPASALENDWEAGSWKQNIDLVFKDGSKAPIDFSNAPSQEFFYQGREFIGFEYKISARATSADYSSIAIDYSEYIVSFAFAYYSYNQTFVGSEPIVIFPDGNWYQLVTFYISMETLAPGFNSTGLFDLSVSPDGLVRYNPDNTEWSVATLPIPTTIEIQNKGHLEFELGDETSPMYTTKIFRPNADGTTLTLSVFPTGSAHWDAVNDILPDNDTTYVFFKGKGNRNDFYAIPDHDPINETGNISSVTVFATMKTASGTERYKLGIIASGTIQWSPLISGGSTYNLFINTWYTNPTTTTTWKWADIDSLQIGGYVQGTTTSSEGRITQLFIVVKYEPVI